MYIIALFTVFCYSWIFRKIEEIQFVLRSVIFSSFLLFQYIVILISTQPPKSISKPIYEKFQSNGASWQTVKLGQKKLCNTRIT